MKRLPAVAALAALLVLSPVAPASHTADPASVTIAGSLQSELGCPSDWQPECAATHLGFDANDGVWQGTFAVPAGDWEYKAPLNDAWDENYGRNAAPNGANIPLSLGAAGAVKFFYDHETHWVTDDVNSVIATAPGSFQSELGCAGDWDPGCLRSWLQDPDGDGTYAFDATLPPGSYEAKVTIDESWDVNYGAGGVPNGMNIPFTVGAGETTRFSYDAVTHVLTIGPAPDPTQPATVGIPGSYQSEVGCSADWQPECALTKLAFDAEDRVWQGSWSIPAGEWEYKAALNDSWDENYGANATLNGPNLPLSLPAETAVKFYYDHATHWITSNRNSTIAVAPGSFQSELGCAGDWDPTCLRSWLEDPDGDGTYSFTTSALPAGSYEAKVALNESWDVNYGAGGVLNGANIPFTVPETGDPVLFSYDAVTHVLTIELEGGGAPEPGDELLVRRSLREHTDEVFYFVLPDRFENGSSANDTGGLSGGRLSHGLDPTDKGFYHGGDMRGLIDRLDYLEGLGVTAIWMAPLFKNRPVQGSGADASAGYHGYWITDFTQLDPHFGTNAELSELVAGAHARGIEVFFDVITNHTADVIDYAEGVYDYVSKAEEPYWDADGLEFDDAEYAGLPTFPALNLLSFPYTPVFPTAADATVKVPAWLNDRTMYHNRGNSSFVGENSLYGDFFGLDDLFTERPEVVQGMIDIYSTWVSEVGIDGFRIDTVKHVNDEFWQAWSPALVEHAASEGNDDFFMFGEVFDSNPEFTSHYTKDAKLQAVLDFPFQSRARSFASGAATDALRDLFEQDDLYIDADSNAYVLPTFLGNHDMGRIGGFLRTDNPGAADAELLARDELVHALMYLVRGQPVVYYGDEQGFTGDGGDKDARQDVFPSQVGSYNDDDLIGTDATTADSNFDPAHPLYVALAGLADLRADHRALRDGAQIHRYSSSSAGVYAFSRILHDEQVEYVVALNNAETPQSVQVQTYSRSLGFTSVYGGGAALTTNTSGLLPLTVPALSAVVYRADAALPASARNPIVTVTAPAEGAEVLGNVALEAVLDRPQLAEVTFAIKAGDAAEWNVLGADDNPPYRVFYDVSELAAGTPLLIKAIARDRSGNLDSDTGTAVVGEVEPPRPGAARDYAVVHYQRGDGAYDGWGLHVWGEVDEPDVTWTNPLPFAGEDEYGRFAWVKLASNASQVGFIVHQGDTKDPDGSPDRFFNPQQTPEIWLKSGDPTVYTSRAAAQDYVELRYHRPDGVYDGWGLHLWGDAIDPSEITEWTSPKLPDRIDDYGAVWRVALQDATKLVNFIVHRGDEKDTAPDRSFLPTEKPSVWLQSGDDTVYGTRGDAEDFVLLHYHRDDGDYGDPTSPDFNQFWGLHVWEGSAEPDITWPNPVREIARDGFGPVFKVRLQDGAPQLAYIAHRGDTKDPGPDQFLDLNTLGHEVWFLSGHVDGDNNQKYLLPMVGGPGVDADLGKAKAHWLTRDTLVWNAEPAPGGRYFLSSSPTGALVAGEEGVTGGESIRLYRARELSDALAAKWPHLAGYNVFRIKPEDLGGVPEALRGQLAVSAVDENGFLRAATGVQIPGVLDDLYANDVPLGATFAGKTPTLRLWAPTAQDVKLQLFAGATPTVVPMTRDVATGVWSITGTPAWYGREFLYEITVYAPSTGEVETNLVTDPYSVALARNSARSILVDLADPVLAPSGWRFTAKPGLRAPEDIALYELHIRDFSINDASVPAVQRGTYLAFTQKHSAGMRHLRKLEDAGLTHVHLLPAFDIATIDEDRSTHATPACNLASFPPASEEQQSCVMAVAETDGFNWGYDPWHYTVPEGSYATSSSGAARTLEFRRMVQELNGSGLRVVMDVVYNHTNASGQAAKSVLDRVVPGYYHRLDAEGAVETSTCCQNTATEHEMMEKLMVDSVVTWAKAYKVDGFRFDLMGHHSKANMLAVRAALDALTPAADGVDGRKIYLYGEGWNFGEVANGARFEQATQANMAGTGIGTFNDRLRDAARGGGPFDGDPGIQGFGSSLLVDPNGNPVNGTPAQQLARLLLYQDQIKVGLTGNLEDYELVDRFGNTVTGAEVDYNGSPAGYNADPEEAITYVEAHDNETLFDAYAAKLPTTTSRAQRARAQIVALSTSALGQGVPFFHAGGDILRSKSMDKNSFNSGDWFNRLFWNYADNGFGAGLPPAPDNGSRYPFLQPLLANAAIKPARAEIEWTAERFRELLEIRGSSRLFRIGDADEIQRRLSFGNNGPTQIPGLIVMRLSDRFSPDLDRKTESIVVLFNATPATKVWSDPGLRWRHYKLHEVQRESDDELTEDARFMRSQGSFSVPPRTTAVFVEGGDHDDD